MRLVQGREFLKPARKLANETSEADWRGSAVHVYHALFLECREASVRWSRAPVGRHNIHHAVRLRLLYSAKAELKQIATTLEALAKLRSRASYDLRLVLDFTSPGAALTAIRDATNAVALLDAIDKHPLHRGHILE